MALGFLLGFKLRSSPNSKPFLLRFNVSQKSPAFCSSLLSTLKNHLNLLHQGFFTNQISSEQLTSARELSLQRRWLEGDSQYQLDRQRQ